MAKCCRFCGGAMVIINTLHLSTLEILTLMCEKCNREEILEMPVRKVKKTPEDGSGEELTGRVVS